MSELDSDSVVKNYFTTAAGGIKLNMMYKWN